MPFQPHEMTLDTLKGMVDRLQRFHKSRPAPKAWPPKRTECQEAVAQALGFANFHAARQSLTACMPPKVRSAGGGWVPASLVEAASPALFTEDRLKLKVSPSDLDGHLLVLGSEASRLALFEAMAEANRDEATWTVAPPPGREGFILEPGKAR